MAIEGVQGIGAFRVTSHDAGRKGKPSGPHTGSEMPADDVVTLSRPGETPQIRSCELRLAVHENSDRVVVEVLDIETGEEIRQIPPEEILKVAAQLEQLRSR